MENDLIPAEMPVAVEAEAGDDDQMKSAFKQARMKIAESVFNSVNVNGNMAFLVV
ncbi:MAG: hypothetical protein IT427_01950 [Pirellulales bacterium]|nr:hypothetical protein [Pirellulales bacterium]